MAENTHTAHGEAAHGETVAHTGAAGGAGHHVAPSALGLDVGGWVALAMVAVIALLVWKKAPAAIARALDGRIATIREQLASAERLRLDAEALKAEYEAKAAAADSEAAALIARAEAEAAGIVDKARTDTAALIERRTRIAEEKVAAAERAAIAEIRARAADAAAQAAAAIIAEQHGAAADKPLVDQTIAGIARVN